MNRNIRRALDIALNAEHPRRFHHEIARTGYAAGGPSSISDIAHDIPYMEKGETLSPISVAKMQPYTASGIAPAPSQAIAPKKVSLKPGKMAKLRMKKPRMLKPKKLRLEQGGSAVDDALDFASRAMKDMAKRGPDMHGMATSQGSTSTVVREKVPGKRAETIYEHHEQTPPEHRIFGADEEPYGMHEDIKNALRLARASGGRNKEIVEPYSYNEYGEFRGRDVGKWRTEHGKKGRAKDYNPWSDPSNMYTHPSEDRHDPEDPMYYISPEEYREGTQGKGIYAMANGGRAHLALGGNPAIGTTPADPTLPLGAAATPTVPAGNAALPLVNAVANPPLLGANPAVPPVPATPPLGAAVSSAPIDPYKNYVNSLYQNVLGRAPDESGAQYWTDQLHLGNLSQGDVLQNFAGSNEFQSLYQADPAKAVNALYQEALGRAPDTSGAQYWQQQAQQGMSLPTMVGNFLDSSEYAGTQPSALQFDPFSPDANALKGYVGSLYQNILGRAPDESGEQYWLNQLYSGDVDQPSMLMTFAQSPEFQNLYKANPNAAVSTLYQTALGRAPDQEGLDYWTQQANKGLGLGELVQNLQNSQEGQDVQNINQAYMDYADSMATPEQLAQAKMYLAGTNPDFNDYIRKTFGDGITQQGTQVAGPMQTAISPNLSTLPSSIYDKAKSMWDAGSEQVKNWMPGLIGQEGGAAGWNAKATTSSAQGPFQFITGTWNDHFAKMFGDELGITAKDLGSYNKKGKYIPTELGVQVAKLRGDTSDQGKALTMAMGLSFNEDNAKKVEAAGLPLTQANIYSVHFSGDTKLARAAARNPNAPASAGLSPAQLRANSWAKKMTVGQIMKGFADKLASADRNKMGNTVISGYQQARGIAPVDQMSGFSDPALMQQLTQSGAGGNVAGAGMFNPAGGPIGMPNTGMTIDPNANGGFAANPPLTNYDPLFNAGMNANAGAAAAGATYFNPFTSQQGSMSFDPNTGIGIQSPLYLGPGQYGPIGGYNPYAVTGYNPPGVAFGNPFGWKDGGSVGTRSRMRRGLELSSGHEDVVDDALRIAKSRSQYAHGGEVWDKPRPKGIGKSHKLTAGQKSSAKAAAEKAGRPYPNLIDNMRAARKSH